MNLGEKIVAMFNDLPLSEKERKLFVNREGEITKLINICRFMQKSIYGLAGETGCGKTTLFNMLKVPEEIVKFTITITEKESKEVIIADILYNLCMLIISDKKFIRVHSLAKEIVKFLKQEEIKSREKGVKIGKIIEGESKWAKISKERYTISAIKNRLEEVITSITKTSKVVLCIDEIDKERKEDVLVILDSIKDILKAKNILCLIALPPIMYQQYIKDRDRLFSEANLENILKDILPIDKMKDEDINEMLNKRTKPFPGVLPERVKETVVKFADGNPREALLLCQNAILSKKIQKTYKREDFILTIDDIKNEMEKFIETRIDSLRLSSREEEALRIISHKSVLSKSELFELILKKSKMPKSTLSETIENLVEKRALLKKKNAFYQINRRVKLHYNYFVR